MKNCALMSDVALAQQRSSAEGNINTFLSHRSEYELSRVCSTRLHNCHEPFYFPVVISLVCYRVHMPLQPVAFSLQILANISPLDSCQMNVNLWGIKRFNFLPAVYLKPSHFKYVKNNGQLQYKKLFLSEIYILLKKLISINWESQHIMICLSQCFYIS